MNGPSGRHGRPLCRVQHGRGALSSAGWDWLHNHAHQARLATQQAAAESAGLDSEQRMA